MGHSAVDEVDFFDALSEGEDGAFDFGDHAADDDFLLDELLDFFGGYRGNEGRSV